MDDDQLLELERRLIEAVAGDWLAALDRLREMFALGEPGLRQYILSLSAPQIDAMPALLEALGAGMASAFQESDRPGLAAFRGEPSLDPDIVALVLMLQGQAADALDIAQRLVGLGIGDVPTLSPLLENRTSTRRRLSLAVNGAVNQGVEEVARAAGQPLVWESERNACVHCLAKSGQVIQPGETFPVMTYGAKPIETKPLKRPPLHGFCRCKLRVLNHQSFADALRRESERSILRGFALETESPRVRLEAAERLLAAGTDAPKSVQTYARQALKKGKFPRTAVPSQSGR